MVKMTQAPISMSSNDNILFCTGMCNNRCIMCCQPPTNHNDIDSLYEKNIKRIHEAPKTLPYICITGGEPTLLGDKLIELLQEVRKSLPDTCILILSNGRLFSNLEYAVKFKEFADSELSINIELHSDYAGDHDIISGAIGSYSETIKGIYNLAAQGISIELRIIICRQNYKRLSDIAAFIHKNLPFVTRIIFMGMECTGFAFSNYESIWIEPNEYSLQLEEAVISLDDWGYDVCVFNIPHCLLPEGLQRFARKSISDWKVRFEQSCETCDYVDQCCGLFSTSRIRFKNIVPIKKATKI